MPRLVIHQEKVTDPAGLIALCPFGALEQQGGRVELGAGCKLCGLCVKQGGGAVTLEQDDTRGADTTLWKGVAVYADHAEGELHPVTLELLGEAARLAAVIHEPVCAIVMGDGMEQVCDTLLRYGADVVYCHDHPALRHFNIEIYTNLMAQAIQTHRPGTILVGATAVGRQLAPRTAARLRTGLTADCTVLEMQQNSDLVQIRPAFGGNIMAEIHTPRHRPQMATVRYKVMSAPAPGRPRGKVVPCPVPPALLESGIAVVSFTAKPPEVSIDQADVLVVAGRGVNKQEDLAQLEALARRLGGTLACTRPLVENGWLDAKRQIGLSGRTVRPKLVITFGVSGAVQFVAGMKNAERIIAVNCDEHAPIFQVAHHCLVGDLYEILPRLLRELQEGAPR